MASFRAVALVASFLVHERRSRDALFFSFALLAIGNGFLEEAELEGTGSDTGWSTDTIVASVSTLERSSRFAFCLCYLSSGSGVHKAESSRASGNTGLRTETFVASIGTLEVGSWFTLLLRFTFRLGGRLIEVAELHRASCNSVFRAEAIVASIGALERTSRYAFVLRWLLLADVPFRFGRWFFEETELHRASSDTGWAADTIVASVGTLERGSRGALGSCWLHNIDRAFLPWRTGLARAEPSDAVGGALAAVAILHLHLVGSAHLTVGMHVLLLLFSRQILLPIGRFLRCCCCGYLRIIPLLLRDAELSRAGHNLAIDRAEACVTVHLECASRFTLLPGFQGQCSSDEHCRN